MSDSWDDRRKAQEEGYFDKENKDALARLAKRGQQGQRVSPVDGTTPLEQITIMGVVVDRCPKSGGIWLDAGELETILEKTKAPTFSLSHFFGMITGK